MFVGGKRVYPMAHGCVSAAYTSSEGLGSVIRPKWLLIGQEGGHILRAPVMKLLPHLSTSTMGYLTPESFKNATYASDVYGSFLKSQEEKSMFYYEGHVGNVNAIDTSPFVR